MWSYITLPLTFYILHGVKSSFTNFEVKTFEVCKDIQSTVKFYGRVTNEHGKQYLSYNVSLPFPIDDKTGGTCLIQTKTIGNNFLELFTIKEKHLCKGANKYIGEFWYDIERQSQILPGVCPIQQGRYHGHHIQLNFEKVSLQTFPFGTLRFTIKMINNTNQNILACIFAEVENIVN